ncbi:Sugar (and other) transporter [Geosmithia morbida]|uniref:Sugar (And other) transporter n=1 Tax=Geosmithia morbida TaxID=1094350 RepID=A0A9P4YPS8_9HYPO|nr:Sugar (and other) transporter [Geosmithia morbida]KAF4119800.1 Sugar (and other) transporter [Geosmithia morbida]
MEQGSNLWTGLQKSWLGIKEEARDTSGVTWRELALVPTNRHRLLVLICLFQHTDAPQIFSLVGAGQDKLLLTGFFGVVEVVSCLFFLLFLVGRLGRRGSLLTGALLMGSYMLIVAVLPVKFPPDLNAGLTPPSIASSIMIYLEVMSYNIFIGSCSFAVQWLLNFVSLQATPHADSNLRWRTFVMFAIFNYTLVIFTWFFIKETRGKSLEEMEASKDTVASAEKE